MNEMEILKKRVKIFFDLDTPCHIITKSGTWINGYIQDVSDEFFIVIDRKDGLLPIFYPEVDKFEFFVGDLSTLKRELEDGK